LVFPEIQQEVLLLLADGKHEIRNNHSEIHTIEFLDGNELLESNNLSNAIAHSSTKHSENGMKWTALFLDDTNYRAIEKTKRIEKLHKLGDFAEVDVGIVTGRNKYFILSKNEVKGRRISKYFKSIIGKTSELRSLYFTKDDLKKYREQFPSYLLYLNKFEMDSSIPEEISNYLTLGEDMGVNDGYKCRIRKVWFHIPSVYTPDAFLYRQIHKFPLVVINQARTTSTDTIHRIRFSKDVNPGLFAFCFFNSLTLAWSEVLGRSYGGGVLELEPSEAEALPIPYSNDIKADIDKTDRLLREGKYTQALDYADEILLKEYLSISSKEIQDIRAAWIELRNRRTFRRK
jgi:adenine-specific DNA-methyltransferase